jgi:hypothetical protein
MADSTFSQDVSAIQNFVWGSDAADSAFYVAFPHAPDMDLILIGAELYNDIEEHDRLVLHFKGHPVNKREAVVSGDPVVFTYNSGKLKSSWHGYVHHVKQVNTHQGGNTDVVCVGASWVLKETDQCVYTKTTYDKAVTATGKKKGFEVITQSHSRSKPVIAQTGESYWQFLRSCAKASGFALLVENTTIFFVSKDKIYQNKKDNAPYFNYVNNENDGVVPRELRMTGTILEFSPIISDQSPEIGVRVDRVISGTDPKTGKQIKSTHPHKGPVKTNPGVVIPNASYFLK